MRALKKGGWSEELIQLLKNRVIKKGVTILLARKNSLLSLAKELQKIKRKNFWQRSKAAKSIEARNISHYG